MKNALPTLILMIICILFNLKNKPSRAEQPQVVRTHGNVALVANAASTQAQINILAQATKKMNSVIQSECFYNFMANKDMIETNEKSSASVARHIQSLTNTLSVNFYYEWHDDGTLNQVAYRQPPSTDININTAYYGNNVDVCELAGTLGHEISHAIGGYDHLSDRSQYKDTIPYSINQAFKKCCI